MSKDFDSLFAQLKLDTLPGDVATESTLCANLPWVQGAPIQVDRLALVEAAAAGGLPRLTLAAPDAAVDRGDERPGELTALAVLGEGGMGQVLLARQHALGREVAVKVLKRDAGNDAADGLVDEARTTGRLEHPGIVPAYALGRDERGMPAVVMRRVDGIAWSELIHDPLHAGWSRLSPGEGGHLAAHLEVLIQVCNATAHAHRHRVLHRDLKPGNVLVGELGEVFLTDWGIALDGKRAHGVARLAGTPAYMAPEMVSGDPNDVDERTDVYLLGATLYEVLTGAAPHRAAHLKDALSHAFASAPPIFGPNVPIDLGQICARALAKDPAARFPSALALRDALKEYLRHRHSLELAQAARALLAELEATTTTADATRWYRLVSECRFAFTRALVDFPGNGPARAGLARCLEVAAEHELARGSAAAARAFVAELEAPRAELVARLAALEATEASRSLEVTRLRNAEREMSPTVSARQRLGVLLMFALMVILIVFAVDGLGFRASLTEKNRWLALAPLGFITLAYLVVVRLNAKALLATRLNRQLAAMVLAGCVCGLIGRVISVLSGTPLHTALAQTSVVLGTVAVGAAITFGLRFLGSAMVFFAGALLIVHFEEAPGPVFAVSSALGLTVAALTFQLWLKAEKPRPG